MKATLSEAEFTRMVLTLAKLCGWRTAHFRPGMTQKGKWVTAVQGDGKGFPDLVLVRNGKIIFAELKVGKNMATKEQGAWLTALSETAAECYVWRPESWPEIEKILKGEAA